MNNVVRKSAKLIGITIVIIGIGTFGWYKMYRNNEKKELINFNNKNNINMNDLKKTYEGSMKRKIDEFYEITDMSVDHEAKFDLVIGKLDGPHGKFINHVSDKGYFILSGNGEVYLGDKIIPVAPYDFIFIPKNTPHGVKGKLEFIIITSPTFNPENESEGEKVE